MANISYLRTGAGRARGRQLGGLVQPARRRGRAPFVFGGIVILLAVAVAAGIVLRTSSPSLTADSDAIAQIHLPLGGATIHSVEVLAGPTGKPVPAVVRNGRIYPVGTVPADERLNVIVVIDRPGWNAWLTGHSKQLTLKVTTPAASLRSHYVTVGKKGPVRFHFKAPVSEYAYGPSPTQTHRHVLRTPSTTITLPHSSPAGNVYLSAAPRSWETGKAVPVSWFPAGSGAAAVSNPAPGTKINSTQPITLTFSKPVSKVLGSHLPPVSPTTKGTWHTLNSHSIQFVPEGYGYGLGASVKVGLPSDVHVTGGQASWSVPAGSTKRLQQLLATLGYLPYNFHYAGGSSGVAMTPAAQEQAALKPPAGTFSLRWQNIPGWYKGQWGPGSYGELTKAAVMAFENSQGMTADGVDGPQVWNALIADVIQGKRNSFGYTVVTVNEGSPESESTWHNGKTVASGPVNTGVSSMPTAQGTFAVFEHVPVTTMSGTNPDGSHYVDPGIKWVSYFNGGDALHEFPRAGYGYPQSDGCVEMPDAEAASVYPFTPIGTVVHVD